MKRTPRDIECWLTDKDGVLLQGDVPLPGASDLINCWVDTSRRFLMLWSVPDKVDSCLGCEFKYVSVA